MTQKREERLIELYEKGVLTKEEARACFKEMNQEPDFLFVEEKAKLNFTLPSFKVFASSKLKQAYSFDGIESLFLKLSEGRLTLTKSKNEQITVEIVYNQDAPEDKLPRLYVEKKGLYFNSSLACHLTISLPQEWMSVLAVELGQADARLDYLPFEDISIRSSRDKKQQDIRLTTCGGYPQHLYVQLAHAPFTLQTGKGQGIRGQIESQSGQVVVNRKKKNSPYQFEKSGNDLLFIKAQTGQGAFYVKGIKDVN
ncbi:hypothetical protein D2A30_07820 [Streptococcus suis]|jgi:hypothetical protein|uniref:hypothetical protein n=1 Tax=Streptococcus parasuis TaxID=1501662 RepID=UPI001EF8F901|nr:hypothetical protein [Streptococcus parasuis]MDG4524358.1 hypothetical protein [Streptococcus suis]ULL21483.1 hypothetical protein D2A30_07820 [Streptococcus suis]